MPDGALRAITNDGFRKRQTSEMFVTSASLFSSCFIYVLSFVLSKSLPATLFYATNNRRKPSLTYYQKCGSLELNWWLSYVRIMLADIVLSYVSLKVTDKKCRTFNQATTYIRMTMWLALLSYIPFCVKKFKVHKCQNNISYLILSFRSWTYFQTVNPVNCVRSSRNYSSFQGADPCCSYIL